jgi:hypothetical protein
LALAGNNNQSVSWPVEPVLGLITDSAAIERSKSKGRSKITNGALLPGIDGRSTWVRRARDLLRSFITDLGGPSDVSTAELALARRCAVLVAQAERLEAEFAVVQGKADNADLDAYLRTANTLRRLLQTLGLKRRAREIVPDPLTYAREQQEEVAP